MVSFNPEKKAPRKQRVSRAILDLCCLQILLPEQLDASFDSEVFHLRENSSELVRRYGNQGEDISIKHPSCLCAVGLSRTPCITINVCMRAESHQITR